MRGTDRVRRRRLLWFGIPLVVIAAIVGLAMVGWTLHPESLKSQLVAAAQRATGRTLTIDGPVGVTLSLSPTVSMRDVSLSNPDGFSRPDMVTVQRVDLDLGLIALLRHRVEIRRIVLTHPDILLESDANGRANWVFRHPPPGPRTTVSPVIQPLPPVPQPSAPAPVQVASPAPPNRQFGAPLRDVHIEDGKVGWIDVSGHTFSASVPHLELVEQAGKDAELNASVAYLDHSIEVTAHTGPLEDLGAVSEEHPWPMLVKLDSGGASLTAEGSIAHPLLGRGYAFKVDLNVPDPAALAALLPSVPETGALEAHLELGDNGGPLPVVTALRATARAIDLDQVKRGMRLEEVTLSGAGASPLAVSARIRLDGRASDISGTVGDLAWLTGGRSAPVGIDLAWHEGDAEATIRGSIQQPRRLAGVALDVAASIPEPTAILDGVPATLKSVTLHAKLVDAGQPMPFQVTSNVGDLEGALSVSHAPRWSVAGTVTSQRLDLDLLRGVRTAVSVPASDDTGEAQGGGPNLAVPAPGISGAPPIGVGPSGSPPPAGAVPSGRASSSPTPSGQATPPAAADPGATATARGPLIPDTSLKLERVRAADADLHFDLANLRLGGTDIQELHATLLMRDGVLRLDPFTVDASDRHVDAGLVIDATEMPPRVHLTLNSQRVPVRPVLAALGLPPVMRGLMGLHANLTGTGDTPRALAATLDGSAGVAMPGGRLDGHLVDAWLARLRPLHIEGDVTDLRCFAARFDAKAGVLAVKPLAIDTAALIIEANGDLDLGNETMTMRVRPRTRIGGTGIVLPVRVTGPFRDPTARLDISPNGLGALSGLLLGGKEIMGAAGGGDPCPEALARASDAGPLPGPRVGAAPAGAGGPGAGAAPAGAGVGSAPAGQGSGAGAGTAPGGAGSGSGVGPAPADPGAGVGATPAEPK
jgi:AsmA protein